MRTGMNSAGSAAAVFAARQTENAARPSGKDGTFGGKRILVACFSRADENYGVGVIEKGNTAVLAEIIAERKGADLFRIERENAYPAGYRACTDEARREQKSSARPALKKDCSPEAYEVIFLGYPIWWGDMPMPVYTWLESHAFENKTIIPFCTHEGSGLSGTPEKIAARCRSAAVLPGFALRGAAAHNSRDKARDAVHEWLGKLAI